MAKKARKRKQFTQKTRYFKRGKRFRKARRGQGKAL